MSDYDLLKALRPDALIAYARNVAAPRRDECCMVIEMLADLAESTGAELSARIADDVQRSEAENAEAENADESHEWAALYAGNVVPQRHASRASAEGYLRSFPGTLVRRRPAGPWEPVS